MTQYHANHAELALATQMEANRVEALVMSPEDFMSILQDKAKANPATGQAIVKALQGSVFAQHWKRQFYPNVNEPAVLPAGQLGADLYTLANALKALGVVGTQVYLRQAANGRAYLILKGPAGLRNTLQGTRYLATNPKVVQLGLGAQGLKGVAKGGFILGLVVSTGIEITEFILNDEKTMMDLVGSIGYEAVKSGVVAGIGYGAGLAVGAFTAVAVWPMIGMFVVACLVGISLNSLDNKNDVKNKVLRGFKALPAKLEQGVYRLQQDGLPTLEQLKQTADQRLSQLTSAGNKAANKAVDQATSAAVDMALKQLMDAVKRVLSPRLR